MPRIGRNEKMPKGKKADRTPEEIETKYREKIEHAVERADSWIGKVAKLGSSKKANLTDEQKEKILDHLVSDLEGLKAMYASGGATKSQFKL